MNALYTILVVLIVIAALLLIAVVLLQNGKGDGLASNFVAGNQTFGVRQTADILEKVTWVLVSVIVVLSVICSFTNSNKATSGSEVADEELVDEVIPEMDSVLNLEDAAPEAAEAADAE